ncbi:polyprenol phosphomannose-dependent alpha 1,6 mannosyltransferase MptB [Nesterenkonia sp. NBAIMH1]|uniref:polyprenol phosphomannose-dependent alpha 1,6 mannosyltransferase MptB n=1 Tax=Nesterenkonia sp. NBAIMH1 TaxID=2600320 RepID=UPI00143DF456|nr:polyprenol phosphomannose-dependent alpha 1,6 mannosyltransferase MptB [Nesterenkonia sp. NBAIMH1]
MTSPTSERAPYVLSGTRGPLVEGLIGSLLILLGSFGVGWLITASPIARMDWVIRLRTESDGVILSTVILTLGCWIMFRAWLRLGKALGEATLHQQQDDVATQNHPADGRSKVQWPPGALKTVNIAVALWSLPQLIVVPIFSRDVFAYLNQGRLVLAGQDPYVSGVSTLENWFHLGTDPLWAEDETPYGPLFLWIEAAVMRIAGDAPDLAILLFRLACVGGVVLVMIYLPKLAVLHGVDGARAQWIAMANPLLIISFISSAHNDALMIGFALAGVWYAAHGRGVLATSLIVLSIGMKPITLVLLPFIGLLWAGPGSDWARKFRCWFATAGLAGAMLFAIGLAQGYGFGWVEVMAGTGTGAVFWSPVGIADGLLSGVLSNLGLTHYWTLDTLQLIGRLTSILVVLWLMFRGRDDRITQRMMWAFTALVVFSPIIQPWYLLWLLPLFAITGIRSNWQLKWVAFTVAFFLTFGAADQLSIHQFLGLDQQMEMLSLAISYTCLVVLALVDPGTRWLIWTGWRRPQPAADQTGVHPVVGKVSDATPDHPQPQPARHEPESSA